MLRAGRPIWGSILNSLHIRQTLINAARSLARLLVGSLIPGRLARLIALNILRRSLISADIKLSYCMWKESRPDGGMANAGMFDLVDRLHNFYYIKRFLCSGREC